MPQMTRFVALLRGVNVAGRNKIGMEALRQSCEALGWTEVRSYQQSGNLVFAAGEENTTELATALAGLAIYFLLLAAAGLFDISRRNL